MHCMLASASSYPDIIQGSWLDWHTQTAGHVCVLKLQPPCCTAHHFEVGCLLAPAWLSSAHQMAPDWVQVVIAPSVVLPYQVPPSSRVTRRVAPDLLLCAVLLW